MNRPVAILSLATASPPNALDQDDALSLARVLLSERFSSFERMAPVFAASGIRARQLVQPIEWYATPRGWPERAQAYLHGATELFVGAATKALDEASLAGGAVDIIVTASSTGVATPSLEAMAMSRMGFRSDAVRIPVFGLGCAGGVSGLALAAKLAAASPGAVVLFVAVEACSLAFRMRDVGKADIVAAALFGDGAAACVLRTGGEGFATLTGSAEHTWPDTLAIMGWRVDDTGLGVVFDRAIPPFVRDNLRPAMDSMLESQGLKVTDVDRFVCHPGGAKVVEALERALDLGQGRLDHERDVLADHGNMSSPTVLFVLDRVRRAGMATTSVAAALGPGFTACTATLQRAA